MHQRVGDQLVRGEHQVGFSLSARSCGQRPERRPHCRELTHILNPQLDRNTLHSALLASGERQAGGVRAG